MPQIILPVYSAFARIFFDIKFVILYCSWHSTLESTKWLPSLSLIIQAATRVVTSIEKDIQPVLVHCSDGWDRTTQIVSLAELLLDPYYRTIEVIISLI